MKPQVKQLLLKEQEQEYAKVLKALGEARFELELENQNKLIGIVRGNMKKRVWINPGDYVLVSFREFQNNKVDIIHKYSNDDVKKLRKLKEIALEKLDQEETDFTINFDEETL